MSTPDVTSSLLAESAWLQRLARSLVLDSGTADELAQETLLEAFERPPGHAEAPRGWLARVLQRRIVKRRRSELQRRARERAVARGESVDTSWSADERMRRHAELVKRVQALSEPYRTAIVLRYFDDLPPREIAARLGVPVSTVLSRIQRGLAALRADLDTAHGGREEWLGAFAAIAWPRADGVLASASLFGVSVLMQLKVWILLGAAAIAAFFLFLSDDARGPATADAPIVDVADERARAEPSSTRPSTSDEPRAVARREGETGKPRTATPIERRGRVVDARGRALAGVPVIHRGALWPRWQNGDLGWINDGENGKFLPPDEVERLRKDASAAQVFFARFRSPEAWRAVVFGEALPERTVLTNESGEFAFEDAEAGPRFEVFGPGWMQLAGAKDADGTALLIAAPSVHVAGRVLGSDLAPLPGARVGPRWSSALALAPSLSGLAFDSAWEPGTMNADDAGRYVLRAVPLGLVGCDLVASATGRETRELSVPPKSRDDFDIVLSSGAVSGIELDGVVLTPDRAPVPGAEVVFGRDRVTTDAAGRFRFSSVEPKASARLTALHALYEPIQLRGMVDRIRREPAAGRGMELVFASTSRVLRGVVVDAEGNGLPGLRVNLFDPTLLDITFTPVEGKLGGWERSVETGAGGAFELAGLAQRAYRLRVWEEETAFVFVGEPIGPREQDVVVQVPRSATFERVRGRVVIRGGALPSGLQVAVAYPIHVTHGGGGSMTEGLAPSPVGADGVFELARVPRRHAEIVVGAPGGRVRSIPVEAVAEDGSIEIELVESRTLRILGEAPGASAIVVGEDDRALEVELHARGVRSLVERLNSIDGVFPPCSIPASGRWVLLERPDASWTRVAIEDDGSGVARAMLPR